MMLKELLSADRCVENGEWGSTEGMSESVWPEKNHQMSIKVAQKWFY